MINSSVKSKNLSLRRKNGLPHWSKKQCDRLTALINENATIAYWCSDQFGRPANSGTCDGWFAHAGLIQEISGPLQLCGKGALHATMEPHKWQGNRVWIVALIGEVKKEEDKLGALKREFLGEILPEEAFTYSIGARLGRKDLSGSNLSGSNLSGSNLSGANLSGADLYIADLSGADLYKTNLSGADLSGADLSNTNLSNANVSNTNLSNANVSNTNLSNANLSGADLYKANLSGADLYKANLSNTNLSGADLYKAILSEANLSGAYCPNFNQEGWVADINGYLKRM